MKRPRLRINNSPLFLLILITVILFLGCIEESFDINAWENPLWKNHTLPTTMADWFDNRPWLLNRSSWSNYITYDPQDPRTIPTRPELATYGMGNGRCFGILGLSVPLSTYCCLLGPYYQFTGGYYSEVQLNTFKEGTQIYYDEEWIWRVRQSDIHITKAQTLDDTLAVYTVDFVPKTLDAAIRIVIVKNISDELQSDVNVELSTYVSATVEGSYLTQSRADKNMAIYSPDMTEITEDVIKVDLGDINPGQEKETSFYLIFYFNETQREQTLSQINADGVYNLLNTTKNYWENWMSGTLSIETPDPMVNDIIEDTKVLIHVQTDESGAVSVLNGYTNTWMRDTYGPVKYFCAIGKPQEAKQFLEFFYKAFTVTHSIQNSLSLEFDISGFAEPADPENFWKTAEMMPESNRYPAEAPSYIVLSWYEYYKATGDLSWIDEHFEYLKYTLLLQDINEQGLMGWSADETFRIPWGLANDLGIEPAVTSYYALNSSVLFVSAAEKLAHLASLLGRNEEAALLMVKADLVREAVDIYYWSDEGYYYPSIHRTNSKYDTKNPFEDINIGLLYFDFLPGNNSRARSNLRKTKEYLMSSDGLIMSPSLRSTSITNFVCGMVPGKFLVNLVKTNDPDQKKVFELMGKMATASGEYCELHTEDYLPYYLYHDPTGLNTVERTSRYRIWETGLNTHAILYYLGYINE